MLSAFEQQVFTVFEASVLDSGRQLCELGTIYIGFSGGLDSTALLLLFKSFKNHRGLNAGIKIVHVNHGLSVNAESWQQHCQQLCSLLGLDFEAVPVALKNTGKGLEAEAREARYDVFAERLSAVDVLLTGHHLDDQAETVLLRLLRGAGPKGLAAMAYQRSIGVAKLLRPLLNFPRSVLKDYVVAQNVSWVEDESNQSTDFDRNYLRQQVMPLLEQRWPEFAQRWASSAQLCRQLEEQSRQHSGAILEQSGFQFERLGSSLQLQPLLALNAAGRASVIRHWSEKLGLQPPNRAQLAQLEAQLFTPQWLDQQAQVEAEGWCWRRYQQRVYLLPLAALAQPPLLCRWDTNTVLNLPGGWQLSAVEDESAAILPPYVSVGSRITGMRCQPKQRRHSQTIKKLLQEVKLEPWLRELVPILSVESLCLGVADLWLEAKYTEPQGGTKKRLEWRHVGHSSN